MSQSFLTRSLTLRHLLLPPLLRSASISPLRCFLSVSFPRHAPLALKPLSAIARPFESREFSSAPAKESRKPSKANSVLPLLSEIGLSEADIATILSHDPRFLCANVEETLKRRISHLREELGFSRSEICHLLAAAPRAFRFTGFERKIDFLMGIFGSYKNLFCFVKRNKLVLSRDVENVLMPKVSFLEHNCGLSLSQISMLLRQSPRLITSNVQTLCIRAEQLGFNPNSSKFSQALCVVCSSTQSTIDEKLRTLQALGFSEAEVKVIMQKEPMILKKNPKTIISKFEMFRELGLSEADIKIMTMKEPAVLLYSLKKIRMFIEYLSTKMGCPKSYVVHNPVVLHFSIEHRLIPRHYVLETLKSKGVPVCKYKVSTIITISETKFLEKFVIPYEQRIPGLQNAYISASRKGYPNV